MKSIFLLFFIMNTCNQSSRNLSPIFSISIWDYNYSMSYTTHYKINNDSLIITEISGIQNESDKILLRKRLSSEGVRNLYNFLSSFPIDSLADEYKNPLVDDGDRKKVEIGFKNKTKTIEVENFYQKDLDSLFNAVNQILDKGFKIKYSN